ncbi:hypothetical protein OIU78_029409 [Salix suchowensis]|nr:hypothetical protein OIU78_029409 [Salix suchowensis]
MDLFIVFSGLIHKPDVRITVLFLGVLAVSCLVLYEFSDPFELMPSSFGSSSDSGSLSMIYQQTYKMKFDVELERVLSKASMKGKTVILTTLNDAWAEPGSGLDSSTEAPFMSEDYLKMMWRRIEFLSTVLQMGYSFVFTDADIMWLRNPFPRFYPQGRFSDSLFWFMSRKTYPGKHDQDVLNKIKKDRVLRKIELSMRFLDTAYFGGFCERSKDFNKVCTMHANCCYGLGTKVHDLKIVLEDWKNYTSLPPNERASASPSWRAPQNCRT